MKRKQLCEKTRPNQQGLTHPSLAKSSERWDTKGLDSWNWHDGDGSGVGVGHGRGLIVIASIRRLVLYEYREHCPSILSGRRLARLCFLQVAVMFVFY